MSVYVDKAKVSEVASHMRMLWGRGIINRYLDRSPEVVTLRELSGVVDLKFAFKCVLLVCLNAFDLRGFRYCEYWGEDALWQAVQDAVLKHCCRDLLSVCTYVVSHVSMPQDRKELLRQTASVLENEVLDETLEEITSKRVLDIDKMRRAVRSITAKISSRFAQRLPVEKAITILSRAAKKVLDVEVRGKPSFPVEIHIAKLSLRIGLVRISVHAEGRVEMPLMTDQVRIACRSGWDEVERVSGVPMWLASSMLWQIGRALCSFDDVAPRRCRECTLNTVCDSWLGKVSLRITSRPEAKVIIE